LEQAEARVRERNEVVEIFRGYITGVVGTHVGPGAWGLFYQIVEEDDPLL
jgi:fatty acid-binding protein DegV